MSYHTLLRRIRLRRAVMFWVATVSSDQPHASLTSSEFVCWVKCNDSISQHPQQQPRQHQISAIKPALCGFFFAWRRACLSPRSSCCISSRTPAQLPVFLCLEKINDCNRKRSRHPRPHVVGRSPRRITGRTNRCGLDNPQSRERRQGHVVVGGGLCRRLPEAVAVQLLEQE